MRPRSLTLAQRQVLLAFLAAADDRRRQTIGDIPGEPWDTVAAFDELLDMGLLRVVPCVRLKMFAEVLPIGARVTMFDMPGTVAMHVGDSTGEIMVRLDESEKSEQYSQDRYGNVLECPGKHRSPGYRPACTGKV